MEVQLSWSYALARLQQLDLIMCFPDWSKCRSAEELGRYVHGRRLRWARWCFGWLARAAFDVVWPVSLTECLGEQVLLVGSYHLLMLSGGHGPGTTLAVELAHPFKKYPGVELAHIVGLDTSLKPCIVLPSATALLLSLMQA